MTEHEQLKLDLANANQIADALGDKFKGFLTINVCESGFFSVIGVVLDDGKYSGVNERLLSQMPPRENENYPPFSIRSKADVQHSFPQLGDLKLVRSSCYDTETWNESVSVAFLNERFAPEFVKAFNEVNSRLGNPDAFFREKPADYPLYLGEIEVYGMESREEKLKKLGVDTFGLPVCLQEMAGSSPENNSAQQGIFVVGDLHNSSARPGF
jgi:hypothetical protein